MYCGIIYVDDNDIEHIENFYFEEQVNGFCKIKDISLDKLKRVIINDANKSEEEIIDMLYSNNRPYNPPIRIKQFNSVRKDKIREFVVKSGIGYLIGRATDNYLNSDKTYSNICDKTRIFDTYSNAYKTRGNMYRNGSHYKLHIFPIAVYTNGKVEKIWGCSLI